MNKLIPLIFLALSTQVLANENLGYAGKKGKVFGYESVTKALEALKANPNAKISELNGWTIVSDGDARALWSFAPPEHPSYPSVVRRAVVERDGQVGITTQVNCGAEKPICDQLVKDFIELNQKVKEAANNG